MWWLGRKWHNSLKRTHKIPSNTAANESASYATFDTGEVTNLTLKLKRIQHHGSREDLSRSLSWKKELDFVWNPENSPNKHICTAMISNIQCWGNGSKWRINFTTSRIELNSCVNVVAVVRNYQIMSNAVRIVDFSPFTPACDSTCQVPIMDDISRCDDNHTGESYAHKGRDVLSVPAMCRNFPH